MSLKTWVLVDERVGNSNQARALAQILGLQYVEKHLHYNKIALFPLIKNGFRILKRECLHDLLADEPDLVISSGRRASQVALALKEKNPEVQLIQLLKPHSSPEKFSALILPLHDKKRDRYPENVFFVHGAVSYLPKAALRESAQEWAAQFKHLPTPWQTVLLGGNSRKCNFKKRHITGLAAELVHLYQESPCSYLISNSRRTPKKLVRHLLQELEAHNIPYFLHDIEKDRGNPYLALLELGEKIIVTGDSISMCSEAALLGKPLYIFTASDMVSDKHYEFANMLFAHQAAIPLGDQPQNARDTENVAPKMGYDAMMDFIQRRLDIPNAGGR